MVAQNNQYLVAQLARVKAKSVEPLQFNSKDMPMDFAFDVLPQL